MKAKRWFYAGLALALVAAASFSAYRQFCRPMSVPEFTSAPEDKPAAVVELEPDFGYRTGDIIKVRIYIHQPAGIKCNTRSLLVNGNTRLRDVSVATRDFPDGSQVLRLDAQLQNLVFEQKVAANMKIEYVANGSRKRQEFQLPDLEFSTSQTFDGDQRSKHPKDPPFVFISSYGWLQTIAVASVACAVMLSSFWYLLKRPTLKFKKKKDTLVPGSDAWEDAIKQVRKIVEQLKAGGEQVELLRGLDGLLRRLFNVDAVTVQDLMARTDNGSPDLMSLTLVSQYCQRAIYAGLLLTPAELSNLGELVEEAIGVLPRYRSKAAS